MQCTKCGGECRIAPEQVGLDKRNMPVYHRYAYCDKCMIKWDVIVLIAGIIQCIYLSGVENYARIVFK